MSELQKLYSSVLNAGLHQQPTVLLLDDSDAMDSSSLEVLALIGTANPGSLTGSFKTFSRLTPVTIILTACKPLLHPSGRHHHPETGFRADLTTSPKVVHVMLGPLEEKAIEILAMQVMQCQALRQDLVDHLMGELFPVSELH